MNLDENFEEEEKNEEKEDKNKKNSTNKEQKTKEKKQEQQEMSIDSGIPDLEHQASESDKDFEEIEVEDKSKSELKKNIKNNWRHNLRTTLYIWYHWAVKRRCSDP